ncbi:MAG: hypothetical protein Q7J42_10800 [Sulfuritalea sp.]|nr:hypothetical protein [Sulfuritalea sp.]
MASQVGAPVATSVVAFDVLGAGAGAAGTFASFGKFLVVAREIGFVAQDAASPSLALALAPEIEVGFGLHQIAWAMAEFDGSSAPLRVRAVVHHGVVFRTVLKGQVSYVGSAIRSTQSALRRAPEVGGLMATRDFVAYASTLTGLPFSLKALNGTAAIDGMRQVVFSDSAAAAWPAADRLPSADPAFGEFVKRRLAEEIGPFAGALVDREMLAVTLATQMVTALGVHVDGRAKRADFERDVQAYIKSRGQS